MSTHFTQTLAEADAEVLDALKLEYNRQRDHLELIASENYTSRAIIEAVGSIATNKYAEGYPGKRYYGGCEHLDIVENLARTRAAELFSVGDFKPHVNVQPHSGAQANQAVFLAFLNPGDTYLAASLDQGGHLTHGAAVNQSGKWFKPVHYNVNKETERFDMDEIRDLAKKSNPKIIIAGYSAYSRTIDFAAFRSIADEVGAMLMVDMAHISGLVAGGSHPSPFPHAHIVTSTTHKTLRGPRSGMIMCHPDYAKKVDSAVFPGLQGGPLMHVIAGKAINFKEAMTQEFKDYAKQIVLNAQALSNGLTERGIRIVSGGTDNHVFIADLSNKNITGKEAQEALDLAGINANRNTIPFDTRSPFVTSGVRMGSAAVTTRGMGPQEMDQIAALVCEALENRNQPAQLESIESKVKDFCKDFPIYAGERG